MTSNITRKLFEKFERSDFDSLQEWFNNAFILQNGFYYFEELSFLPEEFLEIKRELSNYVLEDKEESLICCSNEFKSISIDERPSSKYKHYVQAYINNISVPKTLDEMLKNYIGGNDAMDLARNPQNSKAYWTVPNWTKKGDIVLFMHSKTANSTLTALRTELRSNLNQYSVIDRMVLEEEIANELAFHKKYGGKIFAIGKVCGIPEKVANTGFHYKSRIFCDINGVYVLNDPIDISEFNDFIKVSRLSAITPLYGYIFERLKEIISSKNDVPVYFDSSFSTPIPVTRINKENWIKIGLDYRMTFNLEEQFRTCYVDYLLSQLGDQKKFYKECHCYKNNSPVTFVDNVIKYKNKWLPVEVKLNIRTEKDLKGQCAQYCLLNRLILDNKKAVIADISKVLGNSVLIIDTFGIYMYFHDKNTIEFLYDLDCLDDTKKIEEIKEKINSVLEFK